MTINPDKTNDPKASNAQLREEDFAGRVSRGLTTFTSGTILVVIGFAIGVLILLFDYIPFRTPDSQFIKTPPFQLFLLATVAQTVFWAVAVGSMWRSLRSLREYWKGHVPELITWSLLFATLIYSSKFFAVSCPEYNLLNHGLKTRLLTVIGGAVAIMAAFGTILVNIGLRNILVSSSHNVGELNDDKIEAEQADLVRKYLHLRGRLLHFLSILGIMLGLVTLAQSAKRNLILASPNYNCETDFTVEKVLVFGLYYTLILILIFLPTFSILITTGHKLRDDIIPILSPHNAAWESSCKKRERLGKLLALSMTESLRAVIAILAPVAGSLVSLLDWANKHSSH